MFLARVHSSMVRSAKLQTSSRINLIDHQRTQNLAVDLAGSRTEEGDLEGKKEGKGESKEMRAKGKRKGKRGIPIHSLFFVVTDDAHSFVDDLVHGVPVQIHN